MNSSALRRKVCWAGGALAFSLSTFYFFGCAGAAAGGGTGGTGGSGGGTGGPAVATNSVSMQGLSFVPQNIAVTAGSTVMWMNDDVMVHAVKADPADAVGGGPNSDGQFPNGIPPGGMYSWPVPATAATGTIWFYYCRFHGAPGNGKSLGTGMVGSIIVQ